jgi:hypothetical protein
MGLLPILTITATYFYFFTAGFLSDREILDAILFFTGLFSSPLVCAFLAIMLSTMTLRKIKSNKQSTGKVLSIIGLILGIIWAIYSVWWVTNLNNL